ncbi:MAG: glycosyltransferase family 39 protein [Pseudomonadota bacterium]
MSETKPDLEHDATADQPAASADTTPPPAAPDAAMTDDPAPEARPLPGLLGAIARVLQPIPREQLALAFVVSLAAAILLPTLGRMGLYDCWETHYGEVAREMVVRDDYLYPYWKNAYFFSKPVLLMWLMALGFNAAGASARVGPLPAFTELGARLPVALIALGCVVMVYLAMRHIFNRRAGIFSALVLCTSPMFLMIGRQAITDMVYVGLFTTGLCFFMLSAFSESYQKSRFNQRVSRWVAGFFVAVTLPQYWAILRSVKWLGGQPFALRVGLFVVSALIILGIAVWLIRRGRDSAMLMFYMLVALAFLGKGVGGFALPGLVILAYLMVSWDWGLLRRVQLLTGGLLFVLISFPWYVVLSLFTGRDDESKTFAQRFWVHDHLNRLAAGVHGEKGSFDYFMRQLGFGTLTWAAIMPVALFDALHRPVREPDRPEEKARVFIAVWAVILFIFFTAMQTKFHHYILPVVPPLAMVAGLWLSRVWDSGKLPSGLLLLALLGMTMLVAADGVREPWAFIDMFTYHYISYKPDYYFPVRLFPFPIWIAVLTGLGLLAVVAVSLHGHWDRLGPRMRPAVGGAVGLLLVPVRFVAELLRDIGRGISSLVGGIPARGLVFTFSVTGVALGIFMAQVYMPQLAPHWSQRYLYDSYWTDRRGDEPNLAYLMNWRGETFYALNTDVQIKNAAELTTRMKEPGRKYIIVESKRYDGLRSTLKDYTDKLEIIDRSNSKWYLVRVNE